LENACGDYQICTDLPVGYSCHCQSGFIQTGNGKSVECENINECDQNPCIGQGQICKDSPGTFSCHCAPGYEQTCVLEIGYFRILNSPFKQF